MIVNLHNTGRGRSRGALFTDINITPLVDVMLVLLIVFMITAPMLVSGVAVNLPTAQSNSLNSQEDPLVITVDKNGVIFLFNTSVPLDQLTPKLIAITKANKDTKIFVRGDADVSYGQVVRLMSHINKAGFSKVALVTKSAD
ncbi:Tol-Pal system protein TolR [Rickettsiales endosymbiont of Paramecium tredecaurelia]|uniref:protein TolR n=1 Tax=Candidatus Sarmatiella mevalonica TaxID=2770581 RepID=UPI001922886C|nr:protein TolR [Candidatus Sarmatiella mevalonica]MBL3284814.1 Tol-Pal system protein TolR [Candidatus Sarmatiella mevalonica]